MTKKFSYGERDAGVPVDGETIYFKGGAVTTVTFICRYASQVTTSSDGYDVTGPNDITGSVTEAEGSFAAGLSIKFYTDDTYKSEMTGISSIGAKLFPMVTWEVTTNKLGFFIQECDVINVSEPDSPTRNPADPFVTIIKDTCYAGVVQAAIYPARSAIFTSKYSKFSYASFSFDIAVADKQTLSCAIQFCTTNLDGSRKCTGNDYSGAKPVVDVSNCPTTKIYNYGL